MAIIPKSILKPEGSIIAGVAVGALVAAIYQMNVGNIAQVHLTPANNGSLQAARRKGSIQAVAAVSAVSLLTKDVTVFILGGGLVVLIDWHIRHAIAANPATGQLVANQGYSEAQTAQASASTGEGGQSYG